jgi:tetratricopeptide (TPR) repeat protein
MQWGFLHRVGLLSELAHAQQGLGRVGVAVKTAEGALRHARDSQHLFSLGDALILAGALYLKLRQPELALAHYEEAIALSEENGFAEWLLWSRTYHGQALIALGQITEGIAEMEAGIVGFQRQGGAPFLQYAIALRAEAIARVGRVDESLTILSETLAHITRSGERVDHAEILRLKGEVLIIRDRSSTAEAEQCFREAREVARTQEAKWWELRAALSLARLLRDTNRSDEARAMLSEIYNWFTDGFELPDLNEAKVLLDELSR